MPNGPHLTPSTSPSSLPFAQVADWISQPKWNAQLKQDLSAGTEAPPTEAPPTGGPTLWKTRDGHTLRGGGQALQDYGLFTDAPTVVLGRHLMKNGMCRNARSFAPLLTARA